MPPPSHDDPEVAPKSSGAPRSTAPALVGQVISGRYRVTELLATGGMSSVYLGQHVHMMKRVAIKVLDPMAEQLPELVARFQREAIAGAHVQHPNIASATDFGQLQDGSYFLVLEYVPGNTLNRLIAQGPVGVERAVSIARQIASGLGAAHDVGVVHRDVKPKNIIVLAGTNDVIKVIDFGFAKVKLSKVPSLAPPPNEPVTAEKMLTQAGVVLGTVAYMAPEAGSGMGAVDHRSDLYALGLILYELLAGKHPFDATEPVQLFLQQRTMPPPPIAERAPGVKVPPAIEAVVRKLLEKDPKNRYQSAADFISAINAAMLSLAFEIPDFGPLDAEGPFAPLSQPSGEPSSQEHPIAALPEAKPEPPAEAHPLLARVPALAELAKKLPQNGRFPPWAYIALPVLGIFFIVSMVLLSMRLPKKATAPARTEDAVVAPQAEAEGTSPPAASAPDETAGPDLESNLDAAGWRMTLRNAVRERTWDKAARSVLTLLRIEPAAFRERDVQNAARSVAVALEDAGGEPADAFFGTLTNDRGSDGLDVLYDLTRFRGWTKAGRRALETLRRPDVMKRASAPLKVLFEFRETSCVAKRDAFGKMASDGDDRALSELVALREADCRRRDPCCYKESRALDAAIRTLKGRLASPSAP